ncbi:MAG TPA: IS200/IS605 family element transposase accessory protein TnpB [Oscillatoriales cyanobacterium M4454_W2019_049]|nr:IS200/IS605 family element transposase accessory protein TnpB [Oscillatoriales cyanobacterium M4454_W2019_049]
MLKVVKVRIYPTDEQSVTRAKHFGCTRWLWNHCLSVMTETYKTTGKGISALTMKKQIPTLKAEYEWLKECYSQCLQQSVLNLSQGFQNFFEGRAKYPNFKSKHRRQSVQFPQNVKVISESAIKFPGLLGTVAVKIHRPIEGQLKTVTVSKMPDGKYFASLLVEDGTEKPDSCSDGKAIGIDWGWTDFAITSDGSKFANPRHLKKHERNLKRKQRKLSRKKKGSQNRNKARIKVAKVHAKIANTRADFLHKLSRKIVNENQVIVVEDLAVKNMVKNHNLAKAISDVSWGQFCTLLKYKAEFEGKVYLEVGRFFSSSHLCSNTLLPLEKMDLSIRSFVCPHCSQRHDRDINAAINIRNEGLRILDSGSGSTALGGNVRPKGGRRKSTLLEAVPGEERSPRSIAKQ